jgi:hypothetical protein
MDAIADLHKTIKIMTETKETDPEEIDLEEENPKPKKTPKKRLEQIFYIPKDKDGKSKN